MPTVSVIMNCHNGEKYLAEAIDSVYAQTFQDFEIIFYDNVSTDNSVAIASTYDKRMRIIRGNEKLQTLGAARNNALREANGDWIGFLDTDDRWFPHKLEHQLSALTGTDYTMCYAGVEEISELGSHIRNVQPNARSGKILSSLLMQFDINMVTPLINRGSLERLGLNFSEAMEVSEEYNLFMKIAVTEKILVLKSILGQYRIHQKSLTYQKVERWYLEREETLNELVIHSPEIEHKYTKEMNEARSRGNYYQAVYFMKKGENALAVKAIDNAASMAGLKYKVLKMIVRIPLLWDFIHHQHIISKIRRVIRPFYMKI